MKKTYFRPECIVVKLGVCKVMMAASLPIVVGNDDVNTISDPDEILTKGSRNIWEEEW